MKFLLGLAFGLALGVAIGALGVAYAEDWFTARALPICSSPPCWEDA